MQAMNKPKEKIKISLMRTNYQEGICPGLKAGLACITTFAKDKEAVRRYFGACMITADLRKYHNHEL